MGKTILAALAVAASTSGASAGPSYDRNLERAVMAIVAAKIGDLRSGFDIGQKPIFVGAADDASATPILAPGICSSIAASSLRVRGPAMRSRAAA